MNTAPYLEHYVYNVALFGIDLIAGRCELAKRDWFKSVSVPVMAEIRKIECCVKSG